MQAIQIKPHHLLDIIKLFGTGIDVFQPDQKYRHDFYLIGNLVLQNSNTLIKLTLGCDDICAPCIFNHDNKCQDFILGTSILKEDHNRLIDLKLLAFLHFTEGETMTVVSYCLAAYNLLDEIKLREVWKNESEEYFRQRIGNLQKGLAKYLIQNNSPMQ